MPYVNKKRPYKKEYQQQKARGEKEARNERQRARRALDKKGVSRKGKDVSHNKSLACGGDNDDGYKLEAPSKNRARNLRGSGGKRCTKRKTSRSTKRKTSRSTKRRTR